MLSLSPKTGSLGPQNGDITASLADWPDVVGQGAQGRSDGLTEPGGWLGTEVTWRSL